MLTRREVLRLGDPRLRVPAEDVDDPTSEAVAAAVQDLADTLLFWRSSTGYGRGIAATQIGVPLRIVYLDFEGKRWVLFNPSIAERSPETRVLWDGCLSFDLRFFVEVPRHDSVTVRYQDLSGETKTLHAEASLAELLQHELDHLDGVLAIDRAADLTRMCLREEFEARYRGDSPYAE